MEFTGKVMELENLYLFNEITQIFFSRNSLLINSSAIMLSPETIDRFVEGKVM